MQKYLRAKLSAQVKLASFVNDSSRKAYSCNFIPQYKSTFGQFLYARANLRATHLTQHRFSLSQRKDCKKYHFKLCRYIALLKLYFNATTTRQAKSG